MTRPFLSDPLGSPSLPSILPEPAGDDWRGDILPEAGDLDRDVVPVDLTRAQDVLELCAWSWAWA